MAINAIEIYPTCEIHLLRSLPTSMSVVVREAGQLTEKNLLKENDCLVEALEFELGDLVEVDIDQQSGLITFRPDPNNINTGSVTGRIRNTHEGVVTEIFVRIYVHQDIEYYWVGNNEVTIHEGADNYVLSVYAKFNDIDTPVDISSHDYVSFSSADPSKIAIDDHQDKGRITGVSQTNNPVKLRVQIGAKPIQEVNAYVIEPLNATRTILKCISGSAQVEGRENILFIAEGFTANQQDIFEALTHNISHRLLTGKENSPYHLLKDKFNVWIAFEPSPQEGIAILRPVESSSGKLLEIDLNNDPFQQSDHVLIQVPNNKHGLAYGHRYGDQVSDTIDVNAPPNKDQWLIPHGTTRTLLNFDRRRLARNWRTISVIDAYLDTLQVNPDWHSGGQYANLNDVWKSSGKNRGLVCWFVNDDLDEAANLGGDTYAVKALAKKYRTFDIAPFPIVPGAPVYNHIPRPLSLKHAVQMSSMGIEIPTVTVEGTALPMITATLAHEFAHGFGLGDEYETGPQTELLQGNGSDRVAINGYPNLTHLWKVKDNNKKVDLNKVVWNQWHRVKVSAMLTTQATNTGNTIQLEVNPVHALAWDLKFNQPNQEVFLRTRDINFDKFNPGYFEGPFTLNSINIVTGEIELTGSLSKDFPSGSILYLPKEIDGKVASLIHPKVIAFFNDPAKNNKESFAKKDRSKNECDHPNWGPSSAPAITGFSVSNQQYVVGVYEGGGNYNCNVYRPSGQCRMRKTGVDYLIINPFLILSSFPAFCPVCKYHLVNKVNPEKLGELDQEYPS